MSAFRYRSTVASGWWAMGKFRLGLITGGASLPAKFPHRRWLDRNL